MDNYERIDEKIRELASAWLNGDQEIANSCTTEIVEFIKSVLWSYGGFDDSAMDVIIQNIMLRFGNSLAALHASPGKYVALNWLRRNIEWAKNDHLRRRYRHRERESVLSEEDVCSNREPEPSGALIVLEFLSWLSPIEGQIVRLRMDGLKVKEIAEKCGLHRTTVYRMQKEIKKRYREYDKARRHPVRTN